MLWFNAKRNSLTGRDKASVSEVVACFRDERDLLFRLAWLIAGDRATAEQSVVNACNMTVQGHSPFRDWLTEWAKSSTIMSAISKTLDAIRSCEPAYKDLRCLHPEHRAQGNDAERRMSFLFGIDPSITIAELDPLARSVLVLRTATRASIQDCALRLNVSRSTVLAANCRAMTWIRDRQPTAPSRVRIE
jgi:DNA-directed RNA polymerase specialized sigma24 family protein